MIQWILRLLWRIVWRSVLILVLSIVVFRWVPIPTTSVMLQQKVVMWSQGHNKPLYYNWIDYEAMSKQMSVAVIASEDQRFLQHHGIDWQATRYALAAELQGQNAGGGSTITQQVAKNLYLWHGRSYVRKGLEWGIALLIDLIWSKERILEVYLNIAQFGKRTYGVDEASRRLLKTNPKTLSTHQSALLAAVLPAPSRYKAWKPSNYVKKRQRRIVRQMVQLGGTRLLRKLD